MAKNERGLTPKQEAFCIAYVANGMNASQAARDAGYSQSSARQRGRELLDRPHVQQRIQELVTPRLEALEIDADRVIREVGLMAMARMSDLFRVQIPQGGLKPHHLAEHVPDTMRAAIQKVKVCELTGNVKEIVLHDKLRSIELLGRWKEHGWWKDTTEHTADDALTQLLTQIAESSGPRRPVPKKETAHGHGPAG